MDNHNTIILEEFDPMCENSFLRQFIYNDFFNHDRYKLLIEALYAKDTDGFDEQLKIELHKITPYIIQYVRSFGQRVVNEIAKKGNYRITNIGDDELIESFHTLVSRISFFMFSYFEEA